MQVTTTSFGQNFLNNITQLESRQTTLQNEATSGLKVTEPEDNPAVMNQVLNLQTQASEATQYQSNISNVQATADTASDALKSLQTIVENAGEIATQAGGVNSSTQLSNYATQVGQLIQEALQVGNTTDSQGNYIFGGTATGSPPFSATTDANGNVTGVTYNGNTGTSKVEIAQGLTVTAQTAGENNSGSGASGVFADSRSGADIFSHLISLQQNLASGNTSSITSTDAPALTNDENNVVSQISSNGVVQSALEAAGNSADNDTTNIDTQMSNDTSADLAQTLTLLSQTQTAYQATLQSGVMISNLSLMDFLT
jgi:flagellar hook-associated protein 3 FlgL